MSKLKATPGPWFACPSRVRLNGHTGLAKHLDGRWVINPVNDFERAPLAEVDCGDDECPETRKHAEHDAHLIAAAPELYEALEILIDQLPEFAVNTFDIMDEYSPLIAAKRALKKARGE